MMWYKITISIACCGLGFFNSQAQQWTLPKNHIKVDLFQAAYSGNAELDYERYFKNRSSVLIAAGYTFNGLSTASENYERSGFTGELQARKYLLPYQPNDILRFYMGAFFRYRFVQYTREETIGQDINGAYTDVTYHSLDQFTSFFGGVTFGINIYAGRHVVFDLFAGCGMKINGRVIAPDQYDYIVTNKFGSLISPGYAGVLPRFGLKIGGAF